MLPRPAAQLQGLLLVLRALTAAHVVTPVLLCIESHLPASLSTQDITEHTAAQTPPLRPLAVPAHLRLGYAATKQLKPIAHCTLPVPEVLYVHRHGTSLYS
jgi:hypothetical protein